MTKQFKKTLADAGVLGYRCIVCGNDDYQVSDVSAGKLILSCNKCGFIQMFRNLKEEKPVGFTLFKTVMKLFGGKK